MRIGIDFDDVIYPYHDRLKLRILDRWGVDLRGRRITTFYYDEVPELAALGADRKEVWRMVQQTWLDGPDHAEAGLNDPAIPGVLEHLRRLHEVVVISARAEASRDHVESYLERHGLRVDAVELGRFDKVGFDVLIDDFPKHAVENARAGGWGLLYTTDENSTFDESKVPRVLRVSSWAEARRSIDRIQGLGRHG